MKNKKWVVVNNKFQKNKDIVVLLPILKLWFSKNYWATGQKPKEETPAFGIAISWLKWNYYFTIQKKELEKLDPDFMYKWIREKSGK